jgi:hypothetical protein
MLTLDQKRLSTLSRLSVSRKADIAMNGRFPVRQQINLYRSPVAPRVP